MMATSVFRFRRHGCLAVVFLAALVAACSSTGDGAHDSPASSSSSALNLEPAGYDVERYDLQGTLDWNRNRLVASVGITLTPSEGTRAISLDSAVTEIHAVRSAGVSLPFTVDPANQKLLVDLPEAFQHGRMLRLDIDYEAESVPHSTSGGEVFFMAPRLEGDPAPARQAFTQSEFHGARLWMPSHDEPSDRAVFSIDLRLALDEDLVANGERVLDQRDPTTDTHRVKYDSGFTLPTYIMAFAAGELEVDRRNAGRVPLALWHRKGVATEYDSVAFEEAARAMATYESLLGVPYPFHTYAQVYMPGGLGEENATISLVGDFPLDEALASIDTIAVHELSHQWFGDLVTVRSFYDDWFKEGMATLLQGEAMRVYTDEDHHGTLGGEETQRSTIRDGDPILRDPSVPATPVGTGAYSRAAWLLTQIRSHIGERAFWGTLRGVLERYRYGVIDSAEFVDSFAPVLDAPTMSAVKRAVAAKKLPRLHVEPSPSGALLTLHDPDGSFITPMSVRWVAPDGSTRDQTLAPDTRVALEPRPGEFLVVDPRDVHPAASLFAGLDSDDSAKNYAAYVEPLLVPQGRVAIAQWLRVGGIHQATLLARTMPAVAPRDFEAFVDGLDAEQAKSSAVQRACEVAGNPALDALTRAQWSRVLARALARPLPTRGVSLKGNFAACSKVVDVERVFAADWAKLETGLPEGGISEARLSYLSRFELPVARSFSVWSAVARRGKSEDLRDQAIANLSNDAFRADQADLPRWRAFFSEMMTRSEAWIFVYNALFGVVAAAGPTADENAGALTSLNVVLHDPVDYWFGEVQADAVCAAYALIPGSPAAPEWQIFVSGLADAALKPDIRALIADPSPCASGLPF
ncbi:MAG TPA: M1 family aminopeptidase [Polyangiaceae bacterium]|nr:M1 family aminopeptidase [Polyangiaceae bacterium]